MALNSENVRVAVTGAVSIGPTTVTAPIDADSTVAGVADLGYVSEDGVTETRDRSTNKIKAWQNADTVREVVTEAGITFAFVVLETKRETVEMYYGTEVDEVTGAIIIVPSATGGRHSFVIDVVDGDDFIRIWIPSGEVTEVGDQVYASGEPIGYEVTVTAYPHASLVTSDGKTGSAKKFYSSLAA